MANPKTYHPGPGFFLTQPFKGQTGPDGNKVILHPGEDYVSDKGAGTQVKAASDGLVVYSAYNAQYDRVNKREKYKTGYGYMVVIRHVLAKGEMAYTVYAHLNGNAMPRPGQRVRAGEKIGEVGNSGKSTGDHLHFEVILPNPGAGQLHFNTDPIPGTNITPLGIPENLGRVNPGGYENWGEGGVYNLDHPAFKEDMHFSQSGEKKSFHYDSSSHSSDQHVGKDTLERHGDHVYRIEEDGSSRGSFYSR